MLKRKSSLQTLIVLQGLFSEGIKSVSVREIRKRMNELEIGSLLCEQSEKPKWYWNAIEVIEDEDEKRKRFNDWEFSDRLKKKLLHIADNHNLKKEEGKVMRIFLRDLTSEILEMTETQRILRKEM